MKFRWRRRRAQPPTELEADVLEELEAGLRYHGLVPEHVCGGWRAARSGLEHLAGVPEWWVWCSTCGGQCDIPDECAAAIGRALEAPDAAT